MRSFLPRFVPAAALGAFALIAPLRAQPASTAVLNGQVFINQGLVGVGRIPAAARDKFGETLGSFSALTHDPKSWKRNADGSYVGTFYMQPDRGYNNPGTTNWRARFFTLAIAFAPSPAGGPAQNQVGITVADTTLLTEADGTPFTALDTAAGTAGVRAATAPLPPLPQAFNGRISIDAEGIARLSDGSFSISDEYGPSIYKFSADGKLLSAIRPPEAVIPKRNGTDAFTSNNPAPGQPAPVPTDPTAGRQNNQGLEGLSLSPDGKTLFALLQSAARQDGGAGSASTTPTSAIFNAAGQQVAANDDWGAAANLADLRAATTAVGAFVLAEAGKDSALLVTLDPGVYSAQVNGVAGLTGVSLLEIYEVP